MKYLYLAAPPDTDRDAGPAIRSRLEREFAIPAREIELPDLGFARDPRRGQYASTAVLQLLLRLCPPDAVKLLALTGHDLFIPALTFVFGHAQLDGRVAVVSFARLRQEFYGFAPNRAVFLDRACKEALHETGHMFGLVHCADSACAMSLATGVGQIDRKHAAFCAACVTHLARLKEKESS